MTMRLMKIPKNIAKGVAHKYVLPQIDEIQALCVGMRSEISMHGHEADQWEVYIVVEEKTAYVCLVGKEHTAVNTSNEKNLNILAIKGRGKITFNQFKKFFGFIGFDVREGSIVR